MARHVGRGRAGLLVVALLIASGSPTAIAGSTSKPGKAAKPKPAPVKPVTPAPTPPPAPPAPPPPPPPTPAEQARAKYADAAAKYQAGDFAGAATAFREAYALAPDPAFLFDIAQAYRLGKDCGNATPFYRAFLAAAPARARHRADAIAALRACVTPTAAAAVPAPPPAAIVRKAHGGSAAARIAGLTTAGAGVLAAGVAAIFGWRAHQASSDIQGTLSRNGGVWTDGLQARQDEAQRADTAAIALSAGGAAGMALGGLLWYLGREHVGDLVVTPHGDGAAVGWTTRF